MPLKGYVLDLVPRGIILRGRDMKVIVYGIKGYLMFLLL